MGATHSYRPSFWHATWTVSAEADGLRYETGKGKSGLIPYGDIARVRVSKSTPPGPPGFRMKIFARGGRRLLVTSAHFCGAFRTEDRPDSYREFVSAAMAGMAARGDSIRFEAGDGWAAYAWVCFLALVLAGVLVWDLFLWEPRLVQSQWMQRTRIFAEIVSALWALMYLGFNRPRPFDPRRGLPPNVAPESSAKK